MTTSHAGGGPASQRLADAFGNTISSHFTGTWIDSWSASGHNTKEYDLEADLVYMYQRWYDPKSGTFASMAPYPPMREHEYGFARNSPNHFTDPFGRDPQEDVDAYECMVFDQSYKGCMECCSDLFNSGEISSPTKCFGYCEENKEWFKPTPIIVPNPIPNPNPIGNPTIPILPPNPNGPWSGPAIQCPECYVIVAGAVGVIVVVYLFPAAALGGACILLPG
ncbi:MAG: RHS repeat-associated core domain-containing protein [Candidatus Sumerlaeia bacterium]|nr:RHS repeat-associated core domain-containing protein [Candidatus Sumerlaeia bacterium]